MKRADSSKPSKARRGQGARPRSGKLSMRPLSPEQALSAFVSVPRDKVLEAEKREKKGK